MQPGEPSEIVPSVTTNINLPPGEKPDLVQQEQIAGLCKEIMTDIQADAEEITTAYTNFAEMVFNAGDATSASKEALVNLLNMKANMTDKKTKVLEMMMKAFFKDGGPKNVTTHQHTEINIDKRKLLQKLAKGDSDKAKAEAES